MKNKGGTLVAYVLVVSTSALLFIGSIWFVVQKEVNSSVISIKGIESAILNEEKQVDKRLVAGLQILELLYKQTEEGRSDLQSVIERSGVDSVFFYNKNGIVTFSSTGSLGIDKFKDYYQKLPPLFERNPEYKSLIGTDRKFIIQPLRVSIKGQYAPFKSAMTWSNRTNCFLGVRIRDNNIKDILYNNINFNQNIISIKVVAPSGHVIAESENVKSDDATVSSKKMSDVCNYIRKSVVKIGFSRMMVKSSFGDDNINLQAASHGLTCDNKHYFYTAVVEFDISGLIFECFAIFTLYVILTILSILYLHAKCNLVASMNEKAEKILSLCNTRLREVRRYVTKIAKDSMRTRSMKLELSNEMFNELEDLFKEIDGADK